MILAMKHKGIFVFNHKKHITWVQLELLMYGKRSHPQKDTYIKIISVHNKKKEVKMFREEGANGRS